LNVKTNAKKVETYTAAMTPEQRRIFGRLITLPETYGAAVIREQFHCSRATAEVVATAIADFRLTPAQRKAKEAAAAVEAAKPPRRDLKPVTKPGSSYPAFSDAALDQLERDFPTGGSRWSDEQGKWVAYIPK
jgi:hypothetical protein